MMKLDKWKSVATVLLVVGLTTACQTTEQVKYSGFLKNYSQLKPDPKFDGAHRWQDPSVNLAGYNKFIVDPVLIHLAPQADGVGLDPAELADLTAFARGICFEPRMVSATSLCPVSTSVRPIPLPTCRAS